MDAESDAINEVEIRNTFAVFTVRTATHTIVIPILLSHLASFLQHSAFVSREQYRCLLSTLLVQENQGEMFRNRMSTVLKAR